MPLSERTKATLSGANVVEAQYCTFAFDPGATPIYRLSDEVPSTTRDMTALYKWEHGDVLYGTHAKEDVGMKSVIDDTNKAFGREKDYEKNMIFVNTLNEKKLVSEQLDELR